jgi:hypothetical protein
MQPSNQGWEGIGAGEKRLHKGGQEVKTWPAYDKSKKTNPTSHFIYGKFIAISVELL